MRDSKRFSRHVDPAQAKTLTLSSRGASGAYVARKRALWRVALLGVVFGLMLGGTLGHDWAYVVALAVATVNLIHTLWGTRKP